MRIVVGLTCMTLILGLRQTEWRSALARGCAGARDERRSLLLFCLALDLRRDPALDLFSGLHLTRASNCTVISR